VDLENQSFEEFRLVRPLTSWVLIIGLSLGIVVWGILIYFLISDTPRQWDYGILPDTPAESIYSTIKSPTTTTPPRQLPELPEAVPMKKSGGRP